jgi:hypothetical protein
VEFAYSQLLRDIAPWKQWDLALPTPSLQEARRYDMTLVASFSAMSHGSAVALICTCEDEDYNKNLAWSGFIQLQIEPSSGFLRTYK